jgi:hypothetical protein
MVWLAVPGPVITSLWFCWQPPSCSAFGAELCLSVLLVLSWHGAFGPGGECSSRGIGSDAEARGRYQHTAGTRQTLHVRTLFVELSACILRKMLQWYL